MRHFEKVPWLVVPVWLCLFGAGMSADVRFVKSPPTDSSNVHYPTNRPPLQPSPMVKLPIGGIKPKGWLRGMLELEAEGFTGHLDKISRWCRSEGNAWLSPEGKGHSPWEELPYWLKGYGDLGYVLGNERIIKTARKWIEGMLSSPAPDGWFGPRANKTGSRRARGKPDVWPNMVAMNCLQSYHDYSGDQRVLTLMSNYFRWQQTVPDEDFLVPFWQKMRAGDNLESIYWLYNRTGEKSLLALAEKVHRRTADWTGGVANWHGVNITQCFREPAIYFLQAKDTKFADAARRNYATVMGLYGQVPGGMFGADENCRQGYVGPRQAAESCSMAEFMHSFEMLVRITGEGVWADRCEDVAFNSFPASMTPDLKGLHYLTAPNMVRLDRHNKSPGLQNRGQMLSYNPHAYRCCQHNIAHGWPYYAEELWLATADNGLCASLYAASSVEAKVGRGTTVKIDEKTDYPFDEAIQLKLSTAKPVRFPLYLRIPGWCDAAEVAVNGKAVSKSPRPRRYVAIDREWTDGDTVDLRLPMKVSVRVWTKNHNSVSVDRGPLTYSLKIGEKWTRYGGTEKWPAQEVHPTTPWNYGLVLPEKALKDPAAALKVVSKPGGVATQPFTPQTAPVEIVAKARKIPEWRVDMLGLVGKLQPSPARTDEPIETVTLIPMGCARLRISAFPTVSTDPTAHQWTAPKVPDFQISASHCWGGDTKLAVADGLLPKSSNDHSIPRLTWWDHKGTKEWVAYAFKKPTKVTSAEVYWFDDTGVGQCRVPASWRLLYKDGKEWKPVEADGGCAVEKDKFNKVTFQEVETTALRVEVQLQERFSGGILEWRFSTKK